MEIYWRLRGIEKSFGDKTVLHGIDLDVYKGQNLVVLGGSGAGKSVLLRMLIGLIQPNKGSIEFEGKETANLREQDYYPVRKRASYLFQGGALFDSMNIYKNLAYPLMEGGMTDHEEILPIVREALAKVELEKIEHLFPSDLSGGMMKRVALARAIINKPEIVLYDEPTTGLDPLTTKTINRLIRKLQEELQITSVVVTHELSTVAEVADRLTFLDQGQLIFTGSLKEAAQSDHKLLRAYLEGGGIE